MMHPLSRRRKSSVVFRHLVASTPTAATAVEPARAARYTGAANASWLATAATPMAMGSACRATTTARAVTRPPSAAAGTRLRCGPNTRKRAPTAAFASRSQALGGPSRQTPSRRSRRSIHRDGVTVDTRHEDAAASREARALASGLAAEAVAVPPVGLTGEAPEREQRLRGMDLHATRGTKWGTA